MVAERQGHRLLDGRNRLTPPRALAKARCTWWSAAGGTPRKVVDGDAAQPSWAPTGDRIVYWSNTGGQRDIYTVAAAGGNARAVIEDAPLDWSPVWSPDGKRIYFASERGGAMNLWRDPRGRVERDDVSGAPEPVTNGVQASAGLPQILERRLAAGVPIARWARSIQSRSRSIRPPGAPASRACWTRGTTFECQATCRRMGRRSRISASVIARKISSSDRARDPCAG